MYLPTREKEGANGQVKKAARPFGSGCTKCGQGSKAMAMVSYLGKIDRASMTRVFDKGTCMISRTTLKDFTTQAHNHTQMYI